MPEPPTPRPYELIASSDTTLAIRVSVSLLQNSSRGTRKRDLTADRDATRKAQRAHTEAPSGNAGTAFFWHKSRDLLEIIDASVARMSSENLHEPADVLSEETKNTHRAIVSLMEELEAVDWYQQRAEACTDDALRAVLTHNKNEEIEHAMMVLEWLRRTNPVFATNIGTYIGSKRRDHGGRENGGRRRRHGFRRRRAPRLSS